MSASFSVSIRLFGAFRRFGAEPVTLAVATGTTIAGLRPLLAQALAARERHDTGDLLAHSVFASDTAILGEETPILAPMSISVLPPVCGG